MLKKEFKRSDVARMRNLITGNSGDKNIISTGYESNKEERKEGDIWEQNGKTWTIKDGIKQSITKLDALKKLVLFPLTCPRCEQPMKNNHLNKKMYAIHKTCLNCVVEVEQEIKRQGKWDEYVKSQHMAANNAFLNDLEAAIDDWFNSEEVYMTENGEAQKWDGGNKNVIYERIKAELDEARKVDIYNQETQK